MGCFWRNSVGMFSSKPKFTPGVPFEVQRVYDLLNPKPKELLNNAGERRFISEGEIGVFNHKERRTKRRYLYLFNDVLLITKKEGKKSYWLKIYISLGPTLRVEDVPDTATKYKVEFRIYALKKTIILFTRTEDEKHRWLQMIRDCLPIRRTRMSLLPMLQTLPFTLLWLSARTRKRTSKLLTSVVTTPVSSTMRVSLRRSSILC